MHSELKKVSADEIIRPKGKVTLVYFSSTSNNTHRFVQKLNINSIRIPNEETESIQVDNEYVLLTPTYGGGHIHGNKVVDTKGSVPKPVINFLNNKKNRSLCRGVMASGNTNFGDSFALAGPIISTKLNVPLLYQFELLGTQQNVDDLKKILNDFWIKE
ncbi:ribonucleotide reductase [Spiroplasma sp. TIUS-1]|uniref:class Ib ribonucleoside-diphosphate reductase assembly flavoprotein NrdI n=1 Tax=Spiroplasma sp. TIUS-1 TaxID=216963 RepID=UPI001397E190|nr:class Ib ribonucleoside-diphosphate reductase assembly flavoprotein NrdI [Spiroplasma sp. TIUS-1]QHX36130.1 ribonucleotide reductase [Spiroplasma sp. TIUS-1]